jgi:DNA polymerase-3 subunit gamma/tau
MTAHRTQFSSLASSLMSDQRYLVAARKYRPALFKEIVAQEHVTDTLKNAIRLDRLAHAYLFSGPRGVGKTTAARVLAKAINCTTPRDEREDHAEPCRECDSCRAFEEGRSLNIFEIDAASNNKVDDIRELRETVRVPPQGSKKKVYIIDEVHMLSKQAFNALLKTLEEPPPHALFIFATTEPHKVLPTILSRCQRFDFRRIPVPEVVDRLRDICEQEGLTADEESLMLIARKGDGALRDALSAFDQAVSLCGTELQYAELAQAMGVVDLDLFFQLTEHVLNQHSAGVLQLVEHVMREGYDLYEFLSGLAEHLRNLLVARSMDDDSLIEAAEATRQRYAAASQQFEESDLLRLLMIVGDAEDDIKGSSQPRLKLEMALLKMASITHAVDLRDALAKLDRLEQMVDKGTLPASLSGDGASSDSRDTDAPSDTAPSATGEPAADYTASPSPDATTPPPSELSSTSDASTSDAAAAEPTAASEASADAPPASSPSDEHDASSSPSLEGAPPPDEAPAATDQTAEDEAEDEASATYAADEDSLPPSDSSSGANGPDGGAPEGGESEDAPPPPQTGYRDLFGKPVLQKKNEESTDAPPEDAAPDSASQEQAASASLPGGDGGVATATAPTDTATSTGDLQRLTAVWGDFVRSVTSDRIRVGSCLQHAAPMDVRNGVARVAVPDDFHRRQLTDHESLLTDHLSDVLDRAVEQFRFVVEESASPSSSGETTPESDPYERMRNLREQYPVIEMLFDDFGGELVW